MFSFTTKLAHYFIWFKSLRMFSTFLRSKVWFLQDQKAVWKHARAQAINTPETRVCRIKTLRRSPSILRQCSSNLILVQINYSATKVCLYLSLRHQSSFETHTFGQIRPDVQNLSLARHSAQNLAWNQINRYVTGICTLSHVPLIELYLS